MPFGQTVGEQRFMAIIQSNLPKIVAAIDRLAAAVEKHNELAERGQARTTEEGTRG